MAFLFTRGFLSMPDGRGVHGGASLLGKVKRALANITGDDGKPGKRTNHEGKSLGGYDYPTAPRKLRGERDGLKDEWRTIWRHCTVQYDEAERGASISGLSSSDPTTIRPIRIGPFFLREGFTTRDMEKILLHEFLHAAFIYNRDFHHGMTEQVLIYNLGYDPPANPAGTD